MKITYVEGGLLSACPGVVNDVPAYDDDVDSVVSGSPLEGG